jgi:hypothetical protein
MSYKSIFFKGKHQSDLVGFFDSVLLEKKMFLNGQFTNKTGWNLVLNSLGYRPSFLFSVSVVF